MANAIALNGNAAIISPTENVTLLGDVTLSANRALNVTTGLLNTVTISGVISESVPGSSFSKTGAGNLVLSNAGNSFTGDLALQNSNSVTIPSIANSGVNSPAGAGSKISIGANGSLFYSGSGDTTNRTLNMVNAGNAQVSAGGSGPIVFNGAFTNVSTAVKVLTLSGTALGVGEITAPLIDSTHVGAFALSLTKAGTSTWKLTGAGSYTGATTVSAGTLSAENDKALGNTSALTVNGGTLDVRGTTAGTLTLGTDADVTLSSGIINLNLGTSSDQIVGNGAGSQFDITGGTIALNLGAGFNYANTYTVFSNFGGTNSVAGLSFTGISGYTASLSTAGVLSFTAISGSPYDTWAGGTFANPFTNTAVGVDFDNDGLSNLLEFVLGGDPTISQAGIGPTVVECLGRKPGDFLQAFRCLGTIASHHCESPALRRSDLLDTRERHHHRRGLRCRTDRAHRCVLHRGEQRRSRYDHRDHPVRWSQEIRPSLRLKALSGNRKHLMGNATP